MKVENRDVPLPSFHVGQETSVDTHFFGHLDLTPAALLAERPNADSQTNEQVLGHEPESWLVGRRLQIGFTQQSCVVHNSGLIVRPN